MKITELYIAGFGKLENKTIHFDHAIQLLFGENEAGKSTLYQFIRTMLFGFPSKRGNTREFEPKNGHLFGGELVLNDQRYGDIRIKRYKNQNKGKATVLFETGETGDEATLVNLLQPVTLELFDEVYSLEQEQLIGIKKIEEEKLQELLLTIGLTGSSRLLETKEDFFKSRQELYKPSGRKPELNQKLKEYKELRQTIEKKELEERSYQDLLKETNQQEQQLDEIEKVIKKARVQVGRYEQQEKNFGLYREYEVLMQSQSLDEDKVDPNEKVKRVKELFKEHQFLQSQMEQYQQERNKQLEGTIESPAYLFYVTHERELEALVVNEVNVDRLSTNIQWYKKMNEEKCQERDELAKQVGVKDTNQPYMPSEQATNEIKMLVSKEKPCVEEIAMNEKLFDETMDKKEAMETSYKTENRKKTWWKELIYVTPFLIIGVLLVAMKKGLLGSMLLIVGLGIGVATMLKHKTLSTTNKKAMEKVDQLLEKQAHRIEEAKQAYHVVLEQKNQFAKDYQFDMEKSVSQWLLELTLRERMQVLATEIKYNQEKQRVDEQKIADYVTSLDFTKDWFQADTLPATEVYQQVREFTEKMREKKQAQTEISQGYSRWQEPLKDVKVRQQAIQEELQEQLKMSQLPNLEQVANYLMKQENYQEKRQSIAKLAEQLAEIFDLSKAYKLETIQENQMRSYREVTLAEKEQKHVQQTFQKGRYQIHQMEQDGTLQVLYQKEANLRSEVLDMSYQWMDYRLGEAVIQDVLDFLATRQLPVLLATASSFFQQLTSNHYQKCKMEGSKLVVYTDTNECFHLGELSTGTRDQLYMAIRLAFIQLHSQENYAPLLIDDGWLHYDSSRKQTLFSLLERLSKNTQIICFSSDKEMATYFMQQSLAVEKI